MKWSFMSNYSFKFPVYTRIFIVAFVAVDMIDDLLVCENIFVLVIVDRASVFDVLWVGVQTIFIFTKAFDDGTVKLLAILLFGQQERSTNHVIWINIISSWQNWEVDGGLSVFSGWIWLKIDGSR